MDLKKLNISCVNCKLIESYFAHCTSLTSLDLRNFDSSGITEVYKQNALEIDKNKDNVENIRYYLIIFVIFNVVV